MPTENLQNGTDVKNIEFHERVKRFYYKNLFRKVYTVVIAGLIAVNIFSMMEYSASAEGTEGVCSLKFDGDNINSKVHGTYTHLYDNEYELGNGTTIDVYYDNDVFGSQNCGEFYETWTCNNGKIEGNSRIDGEAYGYGSCARGCTYVDDDEGHYIGDSDWRVESENYSSSSSYPAGKVYGEYCDGKQYYCGDGTWYTDSEKGSSVDSVYHDCVVGCLINDGQTQIENNAIFEAYRNRTVPVGETCGEKEELECAYGNIFIKSSWTSTDNNWYSECDVQQQGGHGVAEPQSCEIGFFGDNISSVVEDGTYEWKSESNGENFYELSHGSKINLYIEDEAFPFENCNELQETWTCNNGEIVGNRLTDSGIAYGYGSCAKVCTYADDQYADYDENSDYHGDTSSRLKSNNSYNRYSVGKVYGEYCESKPYYCEDGTWYEYDNSEKGAKVDAVYSSCEAGCLIDDGQTQIEPGYFSAFRNRTVPAGGTCGEKIELSCSGPSIFIRTPWTSTDNNWYSECEVQQQQDCTFKGKHITGDNSSYIKVYRNATVPHSFGDCNSDNPIDDDGNQNYANLYCDNGKFKFIGEDGHTFETEAGVESYGYGFTSCTVANPINCTLLDGSTLEDGKSISAYKKSVAPYGDSQNTCSSETIKCEAGELKDSNGSDANGYGFPGCTYLPQDCEFKGVKITGDNYSFIPVFKKATVPYGTEYGCYSDNIDGIENQNHGNLYCDNGKFKFYGGDGITLDTEADVVAHGYGFTSCTVANPINCALLDGSTLEDGKSIPAYKKPVAPYGDSQNTCSSETIKCEAGELKDSNGSDANGYGFPGCTYALPQDCTFKGKHITGDNSSYITVYKKATMPYDTSDGCFGWIDTTNQNSADLYCKNGKFKIGDDNILDTEADVVSYGYGFTSCTVEAAPTSSQPSGGSYSGGGSGGGGGGGGKTVNTTKDTTTDIKKEAEENIKEQENKIEEKENKEIEKEHNVADEQPDTTKAEETQQNNSNVNSTVNSTVKDSEGQTKNSVSVSDTSKYTQEQVEAYSFAKDNGITTVETIQTAKMNTAMTRIEMAKMLSYYAINVLGQTPDTTKTVNFKDVSSKKDEQYDNGVTLAYQLGIMGQNMPNNKFRPNDKVSRAEFVTALSRLIYNTDDGNYKGTRKYYTSHMAKLYNEGIINVTDPSLQEKRGNVMIMLMRSVDNTK